MKLENDWNEAEKALFEMYNENHGCMFGLDLPKDYVDFSRISVVKGEVLLASQVSDNAIQHEIQ